jgi:hypothetical protein
MRPRYSYRLVRDNGAAYVFPPRGDGVTLRVATQAIEPLPRCSPPFPPDVEVERFELPPEWDKSPPRRWLRCAVCGGWTPWTVGETKESRTCGRRRCFRALVDRNRQAPA